MNTTATPTPAITLPAGVKEVRLILRAYPTSSYSSDAPDFACVTLDEALVARINKYRQFVATENIAWVATYDTVDEWAPTDCTLLEDQLMISADSFWFAAELKHQESSVNTTGVWFKELALALTRAADTPASLQWIGDFLVIGERDTATASAWVKTLLELEADDEADTEVESTE